MSGRVVPVKGTAAASISRLLDGRGVPSYSAQNCTEYVAIITRKPAPVKAVLDERGYVYSVTKTHDGAVFRVNGKRKQDR